jgi:rod shape-determining protein MreD
MNRERTLGWLFAGSLFVAFLLQLLPLPPALAPAKPFWLALVFAYWAIEVPERASLGLAFLLGLCSDVVAGELLGEHALRLAIVVFIALRFRARLRFFPMWQQALAVCALLANDRIVVLMVRGFSGDPLPPPTHWLAPVVGMVVWPFLFLALDGLRTRLRIRES